MIHAAKGLPRRERPTTKSYRDAVKRIVLGVQAAHGLNDRELADRVGCSSGTIKNARTEAANLDGVTLANIEYEFGPAALDPFLTLGGSRAVPADTGEGGEGTAVCRLTEVLHLLASALNPDSDGGSVITRAEYRSLKPAAQKARQALDIIIQRAAFSEAA